MTDRSAKLPDVRLRKEAILPLLLGAGKLLGSVALWELGSRALGWGASKLMGNKGEQPPAQAPTAGQPAKQPGMQPRVPYRPPVRALPAFRLKAGSFEKDRQVAFDAGVLDMCKRSSFDEDDTKAMFRLIKEGGGDQYYNPYAQSMGNPYAHMVPTYGRQFGFGGQQGGWGGQRGGGGGQRSPEELQLLMMMLQMMMKGQDGAAGGGEGGAGGGAGDAAKPHPGGWVGKGLEKVFGRDAPGAAGQSSIGDIVKELPAAATANAKRLRPQEDTGKRTAEQVGKRLPVVGDPWGFGVGSGETGQPGIAGEAKTPSTMDKYKTWLRNRPGIGPLYRKFLGPEPAAPSLPPGVGRPGETGEDVFARTRRQGAAERARRMQTRATPTPVTPPAAPPATVQAPPNVKLGSLLGVDPAGEMAHNNPAVTPTKPAPVSQPGGSGWSGGPMDLSTMPTGGSKEEMWRWVVKMMMGGLKEERKWSLRRRKYSQIARYPGGAEEAQKLMALDQLDDINEERAALEAKGPPTDPNKLRGYQLRMQMLDRRTASEEKRFAGAGQKPGPVAGALGMSNKQQLQSAVADVKAKIMNHENPWRATQDVVKGNRELTPRVLQEAARQLKSEYNVVFDPNKPQKSPIWPSKLGPGPAQPAAQPAGQVAGAAGTPDDAARAAQLPQGKIYTTKALAREALLGNKATGAPGGYTGTLYATKPFEGSAGMGNLPPQTAPIVPFNTPPASASAAPTPASARTMTSAESAAQRPVSASLAASAAPTGGFGAGPTIGGMNLSQLPMGGPQTSPEQVRQVAEGMRIGPVAAPEPASTSTPAAAPVPTQPVSTTGVVPAPPAVTSSNSLAEATKKQDPE